MMTPADKGFVHRIPASQARSLLLLIPRCPYAIFREFQYSSRNP